MIGAIIGDISAYTWKKHGELFFDRLFMENARISEYGLSILQVVPKMIDESSAKYNDICSLLKEEKDYFEQSTDVPPLSAAYIEKDESIIHPFLFILLSSAIGWIANSPEEISLRIDDLAKPFIISFNTRDLSIALSKAIFMFRQGCTKKEVYDTCNLRGLLSNPLEEERHIFESVSMAWSSFEKSWDFTSSVHNSILDSKGSNFVTSLSAAIAESMYSCEYIMLKRDSVIRSNNEAHIKQLHLPLAIVRDHPSQVSVLRKFTLKQTSFLQKNRAASNVEKHTWTDVDFTPTIANLDSTLLERINISFIPDIDNRYGIYLDNGWYYIYRAGRILSRIQITMEMNGGGVISKIQESGEKPGHLGIDEVLYSLKYNWDNLSKWK